MFLKTFASSYLPQEGIHACAANNSRCRIRCNNKVLCISRYSEICLYLLLYTACTCKTWVQTSTRCIQGACATPRVFCCAQCSLCVEERLSMWHSKEGSSYNLQSKHKKQRATFGEHSEQIMSAGKNRISYTYLVIPFFHIGMSSPVLLSANARDQWNVLQFPPSLSHPSSSSELMCVQTTCKAPRTRL